MHHIRKMSYLNPKVSALDKMMMVANRKIIPLCKACQMKLKKIMTSNTQKNKLGIRLTESRMK